MKIKKAITALLIVLILLSVLYIFFVPQTERKTIKAPLPALRATQQFSDPLKLAKWFAPFINASVSSNSIDTLKKIITSGGDSVIIENQSMHSSLIRFFSAKKEKQLLFTAEPDSARSTESLITMTYKTTLFKKWFKKNETEKAALKSFSNLKDYMDDTKRLYGYEIRPVKVLDTAFLFLSEVVPVNEKRKAMRRLFERLIDYAAKKNAGYNGLRIFYSQQSGNDIALFASISVTNRITIGPAEPFEYKMMPFEKDLIEATYQGPFGETGKVFKALEIFKSDHGLISMAIPFQKFMSDGYDFADDQVVQLKVYYPVF